MKFHLRLAYRLLHSVEKLNSGVFRYEEMCSIASILKVQLSTIITLAEWIHGGGDFERFAVEHLSPSSLNKSPVLEVTA